MSPERLLTFTFWQATWRRYRWFMAWLISIGGVIFIYLALQNNADAIRHQSLLGAQTHTAVCALRHDLKERVLASEAFIAAHPDGFAGITVKVLRTSIAGEQKTIKALATLTCP
jgi:hypothetical protein